MVRRMGWVILSWSLLIAGCVVPETVVVKTPAPPAHLIVLNQTDYQWRVTITRVSGEPVEDFQLEARLSHSSDLVGGDFIIKQIVMSDEAAQELSREIPAKLEQGKTYRWRLATLLSDAGAASHAP